MISHKFSGLLGLIFLLHSKWTLAQNTQKVTVFKIDQPIVLDGLIDEDVWKKAERLYKVVKVSLGKEGMKPDDISCVEPEKYRQRFLHFISKVVFRNF